MNGAQVIRPSLWYISIGVVLFLLGVGLFVYFLFSGIVHITDSLTQVVVPGRAELTLTTPGTYAVFLEEQSVVNGRIYSTTEAVNGLQCSVVSLPGKQKIDLRRPAGSTTYDVGGRHGRSVLEFQIREPGQYEFACDYPGESKGPQAVVAVGKGVGAGILRTIGLSFVSILGGMISGALVIIVVVVMRERAKKKLAPLASPSYPA